jgi:hypothetical protein
MEDKAIKELKWKKPAEIKYLDVWIKELKEWVEYNEICIKTFNPAQSLLDNLKRAKNLIKLIEKRKAVLLIRKNMLNTECNLQDSLIINSEE